MTTAKRIGETIALDIKANGNVTIKGAQEFGQKSGYGYKYYKFESQTVIIQGNVTELKCDDNKLTSLDVSGCTSLTNLDCRYNQLTSLDLSKNTALTTLNCYYNQLTSLDLSKNTVLTMLNCSNNQLTSLDVSGCTALTSLDCGSNQLTSLDVSQNRALETLLCAGKSGKTGVLSHLNVSGCTALTTLDCQRNQLTFLDVSGCTSLKTLQCSYNQIADLKASGCSSLIDINYRSNPLTNIDLSGCEALTSFNCRAIGVKKLNLSGCKSLSDFSYNKTLEFLDLSGCENITTLDFSNAGSLKSLDVSNCISLKTLNCSSNQLSLLTLVGCTALTNLNCASNKLKFLDVSGCTSLDELDCSKNQLNRLVLSGSSALKVINASRNELTQLSLSGLASLKSIDCSDNRLTRLDASDNKYLEALNCSQNQIKGKAMVELVNSLPNRQGKQNGQFRVVNEKSSKEGNVCLKSDVALAKSKGWQPEHYTTYLTWESPGSAQGWRSYEGSGEDPYVVQVKKTGEGSISVLGYSYLDAVPRGTELTIVAEPAIGYKLESLTSNGVDILESKRITITESTTIIAVFSKNTETYAVVQEITGRGEIQVSGATNLKSVEYGTELTITATPATGYELKTLTANNADIIDSKRITVKENVTIKAVFVETSYPVTTTKKGEGTITATGADDLSAVAYGTELTINATPAEGYELTALTANGTDILASKKVTVQGATEIKATFTQKTRNFVVTLTKEGEGTITATGAEDLKAVAYGMELTINATPAEGYELTALTANGTDILASKKVTVKEAVEVKATFAKKTFVVTLEKAGEGEFSTTGTNNLKKVPYGTELTIIATPAEGYELTSIVADGVNITDTKKIAITDNITVKATFTKKAFAVTLSKEGEGTVTATGADDLNAVAYGTELTINATPAEGYELTALTANGTDILASKKVTVKEAVEVKATFAKKTFVVTLEKAGEGEFSTTGTNNLKKVPYGTELTIIATPAEGYELTSIVADGVNITDTKKIAITDNITVKATFAKKNFAVTFEKEGEGTITATGASNLNSVAYGTELTINATPAMGYELVSITAGGADITASKKVVVTGNLTVKATFAKKNFAVSLTKEGEGTISATGATSLNAVAYGTELTINATPAEGYELTALTANGTDILASKKVAIKEALEVKATFTKKAFAVTLSKEGEGTITAKGATSLGAVAYGTELTIVATPADGYELTALTANGTDILAFKKVTIKEAVEVKATFSKKSFAVTFDKEGEGTITATGADDLNAVAYGTELTIVATPAEGYELTALTANGQDILATKKVTIKEAVEVKATFSKKTFVVTLEKVGEGELSITGADNLKKVPYGTELTIIATPAEGYELTSIVVDGVNITATKKVSIKDNVTVKATFAKKNFAVTFEKVGEGTITATGASNLNSVAYGTELTIVATPAEGYELTALTANGTDILATKKIVVEGNLTVKATFAKKSFAVSLTKEGEGTITATGASNLNAVAYGTELTINATPAMGYELQSLVAGGVDITATKKIVVKDNLTVKATFAKKNFAVSLTKEGEGMITATGASNLNSVAYGTELTINATPAKGYELVSITANGTDITATKKIVVKDNLTIKATFAKKSFSVSLTKEGEGMISATGASNLNSVAYGTELTIVATPAEGYELTALTANGTDILATKKVVVEGNLTVKATFAKKVFAVSLTKEGEGTITATGASNLNSVAYGTELTINATPAEGYELVSITAGGTDITASKKVVVTGNLTVKATFTKKTFAVTLTSNEHGDITIVEPVNLEAVPYGTTLTVKATGKNAQCVLTELTANGKDILATKSFVVTDVTEVKATFVDHTGVETTVTQQVKLYPNPATDYVIVEGVTPASEVTLHSMTGERLYAGRADDRGVLQIDLTPYADGVYLVCVAGKTYRVVVRH